MSRGCPEGVQRMSRGRPEGVQRASRGCPEDSLRTSFNFGCWNLIFCLQNCSTFGIQSQLAVCNCPFVLPLLSNHNFTFVLCNEFCCNFNYFLCKSPEGYYYIVIYYWYNSSFDLLITIILYNELCQVTILCMKYTWKWLSFWRLSWWWVPLFLVFFCPTEI